MKHFKLTHIFPSHMLQLGGREWNKRVMDLNRVENMSTVAGKMRSKFSKQVSWRFQNIDKFKWMDFIHVSRFTENWDKNIKRQKDQ